MIEKPIILKHSTATITLRKDFYSLFRKNINDLFTETGASYFAHQLIENYYLPGHRISTFNTHEKWHELYWDKYWYVDPLERKGHKNAKDVGISLVSWQISDPDSECMEARTSTCDIRDGAFIVFQHPNGWLENYTLAWKKFDITSLSIDVVDQIQQFINPIRQVHRRLFAAND